MGSGGGSGGGEGGEGEGKGELCSSKEERMTEFLIGEFKERIEVFFFFLFFFSLFFSFFLSLFFFCFIFLINFSFNSFFFFFIDSIELKRTSTQAPHFLSSSCSPQTRPH